MQTAVDQNSVNSVANGTDDFRLGIGMDCCVIPLKRHNGLTLIQTTDFFYPLIDEPYTMGRIAAANTLSDLYAMGVVHCDNMLMLLGISTKMSDKERDAVIPLMLQGFKDCCTEAGTLVTGGQTVRNPWLLMGGVATSICTANQFLMPNRAEPGDVLVLTKPLGIQVAVNAHQWLEQYPEKYSRIQNVLNEADTKKAYARAADSMSRLNRKGAELMHKYSAHAATDVTGFGLLGHAQNLAKIQLRDVSFVIHNLPVIAKMTTVVKTLGNAFGLLQGTAAETSGGLLIAMERQNAVAFCQEIEKAEGYPAWIIGIVEKGGDRRATIVENPRVIEVPEKEKQGQLW